MYFHRPGVGVKTWWPIGASFATGFRDYVENSWPVKDLPPISEIICGKA